jgi:chromate transporter
MLSCPLDPCLLRVNSKLPPASGNAWEVLRAFARLGCTAFGGPMAHLGFFRQEFVEKRQWLDEAGYADLVALCQFLPGPASSQVALALGWKRAGYPGALYAWLGFTLPSAALMLAFASGVERLQGFSQSGCVQGLKLAAVAVVAQALCQMTGRLCPDMSRAAIAVAAATGLLFAPTAWMQLLVIAGGALAGLILKPGFSSAAKAHCATGGHPRLTGLNWLVAFFALLLFLPCAVRVWPLAWLQIVDGFYRTGALVFGGGHVVLPLLEQATVGRGWLDHNTFLAGYGAAQALPGPLFTFAAYLGATISIGPRGIIGGLLALFAIFLPSPLLIFGVLPQWERLRQIPLAQALLAGTNAAVVGLLAAAFYSPICTSALTEPRRFVIAGLAFIGLMIAKLPPWLVVLGCALAGKMALN